LKLGRQIHLYIGVFSAPALLFFALSGALQTFSLHEASKNGDYKPANWIAMLGELHKHQTTQLPIRKAQPTTISSSTAPSTAVTTEQLKVAPNKSGATQMNSADRSIHHPLPMKIFFVIISASLFISVLTGLLMSYRYKRNKIRVTCFLLAGLLIPTLLTLL
jgi:hypothetical protein